MSHIKSISLTKEQAEFVEREHLSLSRIIQDQLNLKMAYKNGELLEDNASLNKKIQRLADNLERAMEFIHNRGLSDEFLEERA